MCIIHTRPDWIHEWTTHRSSLKSGAKPTWLTRLCPKGGDTTRCGTRAYIHQISQSEGCPKWTPLLSPTLTHEWAPTGAIDGQRASQGVDILWEGCRESRRCSRDTYPASYITEYTSVYEDKGPLTTNGSSEMLARGPL